MDKKKILLLTILITVLIIFFLFFNFVFNYGYLMVVSEPSNSNVAIDGKAHKSEQEIKLKPGKYKVTISKEGYSQYSFSNVEIKRGREIKIRRVLATEEERKLQAVLPYDDGLNFKIELRDDGERYIYDIGLYAILNGNSQVDSYNQQLKALKPEAINFIKSYGVNPNSISINWLQEGV